MGRTIGKAVVFLPWAVMRPSRQDDKVSMTWVRDPGGHRATASADGIVPDRYDRLIKLGELREKGLLSEDEFEAEKARLLQSD